MKLSGRLVIAVVVGAVAGLALGYVLHGGSYQPSTSWLIFRPGEALLWVIGGGILFGLVWWLFSR